MGELGQENGRNRVPEGEPNEASLFDYIRMVWGYRWLVLGLCGLSVLTTFVMTIRMPKIYESTVTLLTPREGMGGGFLGGFAASGLLQQMPGLSIPSLTPNRDTLVNLLKSRRMAQAVVEQFGLQERYRASHPQEAIGTLQGMTTVLVSQEGVISIKVEDADPRLAADLANFYVEHLNRLVSQLGVGEAGRQRLFLTEQLARVKSDLESAEQTLRRFQERDRAIVLPDQTREVIAAAARLKGEIMAAEVQLQVMRNFATEANPEVVALRRKIEELRRQLASVEYGGDAARPRQGQTSGRNRREISVPFARVPELGLELARLTREAKVQETLVTLLSQQVEQARLAEARDLPTVQVLDRAIPALLHSKPKLRLNLIVTGVVSLFVGVFLAFVLNSLRKVLGPSGSLEWEAARPDPPE